MKKYVLLTQIVAFAKGKERFNLADLMQEFSLSRSTALRYVAALEELGVPIVSEKGRYGAYSVAPTYRIDPIRFSSDEIHAILFALDSMEVLKTSPFKQHFANIGSKLLHVLPASDWQHYQRLKQCVAIKQTQQIQPAAHLEAWLQAILEHKDVSVHMAATILHVKPLALWFQAGKWLVAVFDWQLQDLRVWRCDEVGKVMALAADFQKPQYLPDFTGINVDSFDGLRQKNQQHEFVLTIVLTGVALYHSKPFAQIQLYEEAEQARIVGAYNDDETEHVLDYINRFYRHVLDVQPDSLRRRYVQWVQAAWFKLAVRDEI